MYKEPEELDWAAIIKQHEANPQHHTRDDSDAFAVGLILVFVIFCLLTFFGGPASVSVDPPWLRI